MRQYEFLKLPRLTDQDDFSKELEIGDKFLYGPKMISQIESKLIGEEICFYKVYNKKEKNVEYGLGYEILEKN